MIPTVIPAEIQEYIDIVEQEKLPVCKEQKQLITLVKSAFQNEKLYYDTEQISTYMRYQMYFPFKLFEWEKFVFVLHNCIFQEDGDLRWPDLLILCGRGAGKNGYLSFEAFCQISPANGILEYDIDICATSEDQAMTSFNELYNILETPKFSTIFRMFSLKCK